MLERTACDARPSLLNQTCTIPVVPDTYLHATFSIPINPDLPVTSFCGGRSFVYGQNYPLYRGLKSYTQNNKNPRISATVLAPTAMSLILCTPFLLRQLCFWKREPCMGRSSQRKQNSSAQLLEKACTVLLQAKRLGSRVRAFCRVLCLLAGWNPRRPKIAPFNKSQATHRFLNDSTKHKCPNHKEHKETASSMRC